MAIRFVDKTPDDDADREVGKPRPKLQGRSSMSAQAPLATVPDPPTVPDVTDPPSDAEPKLPHPKPEPRVRGRKAPPARTATPMAEPVQVSLEGVLPVLPHAKPEPKPRGRKKAFG